MAKKKTVNKGANQSDRTIQYIGAALILIVVAVFAWQYIPKNDKPLEFTGEIGLIPACDIFDSIPATVEYAAPPPQLVDKSKLYFATFKMAKDNSEFVVVLFTDRAPVTVNSFAFLSCKGYFNGVTFHRVLDGFMAQGGDPSGTGAGGPGYEFINEDSDLTFDKAGVVAMANAGRDTNGSQFFITFGPQEFLNGGYTIFGQVVEGMGVVNGITLRDPDTNPNFEGDKIESITITKE